METLKVNLIGSVRRDWWGGREYVVAPATLIVPDRVLPGSKGPLYYPASETKRNVYLWDGLPITLYHPEENGVPMSGRQSEGIGFTKGTTHNDKLETEAWFDVERTDADLVARIERGDPMELSTGLYTEEEEHEEREADGVKYSVTARDYRPDHVAVLPDGLGACSVKDGCGINVNAGVNQPKSKATGRYKHLGAGTGRGPVHEAAQRGAMVLSVRDRMLGQDAALQAEQGRNPPSWVEDEGDWERAKGIVDEKMPDCDDYYACVSYIYQRIGGGVNNEVNMGRIKSIEYLVANCDCWKGKEKLLANKEEFSDEDVERLVENLKAAEIAAKGVTIGKATVVFNGKKMVVRNEEGEECEPDDEECMEMMKGKEAPAENTLKAWEDAMPPQARAVWNTAKKVELERRQDLVRRLVVNLKGEARDNMARKLLDRSVPELEELVQLVPAPVDEVESSLSFLERTDYGPMAGSRFDSSDRDVEDVLDLDAARAAR